MPAAKSVPVDDGWRIPDDLWTRIEPLLPPEREHPHGGRPWTPARQVMDGIFFVLRTGCQWKALPRSLAAPSTVHERFQTWEAAGVFRQLWVAGLEEYDQQVGIQWDWQAMDGAMTKAPLGGEKNRAQSDRSGQGRSQALVANGGRRRPDRPGRGRGQPQRHAAGRRNPGVDSGGATRAHPGGTAGTVDGQGL